MTTSDSRVSPGACPTELNGMRVLIVEDSWDVGMGLKSLLNAWGADVIGPVATTHDAMRLVSERAPEAALIDINLRDGEKSYSIIDQLYEQGIHIVVISGYADIPQAKGKASAILQKPFRDELLLASLRLPMTK